MNPGYAGIFLFLIFYRNNKKQAQKKAFTENPQRLLYFISNPFNRELPV